MLIRHLDQISGTERDVHGAGWRSRRLVVADDGLKCSFHVTILKAGARLQFEYRDHREIVFCVEGEGTIEDLSAARTERITPGSIYSAGIGEPHPSPPTRSCGWCACSIRCWPAPRRPTDGRGRDPSEIETPGPRR